MGFEPMTMRYRCNALSTELPSHIDRWVASDIPDDHRVYRELTIDHLSIWLGFSVDRALHRYRKD